MYKSKFQELCQQNSWSLPSYATTKEGPDHKLRFTATVTVNGVTFETTDQSGTAKDAQNKAAKLAFNHFAAPKASRPPANTPLPNAPIPTYSSGFPSLDIRPSIGGALQPTMIEIKRTALVNKTPLGVKDDKMFIDVHHLHKNRLQNYTQKKNRRLPEYSCESEGPPHSCRFKCKVTVDGKTYWSPEFFPTVKEAEHAAAKVAWESLPLNEVQEYYSGLYKNLLRELAQKEDFNVPKYQTTIFGPPHMPTVVSTVEIGGQSFRGQAAKSKKLAEMNAAKVAYSCLQEQLKRKYEERAACSERLVIRRLVIRKPGTLSYRSDQASRIRSSPHIEGNYTLHVYIPVRIPCTPMKELAQFLKKVSSRVPSLNAIGISTPLSMLWNDDLKFEQVALGREFHITLARTVPIRVHQIDSMVVMLRQKLQFQRYWIDFSKLEVFVNDDQTRSFLSIEVISGGLAEIRKQIEAVNEVYKLHNLPEFYKDPRPHISIAWALGDVSELLKRVVEEVKRHTPVGGYVQKHIFTCKFSGIKCKIGDKIHTICKVQGGV